MTYRKVASDHILRGTILAIAHRLFPGGIPKLADYARETAVAFSTLTRTADWLLERLGGILETRRPGPPAPDRPNDLRAGALGKLQALRSFLVGEAAPTETNRCYTPEAKQRIASVSEEILAAQILTVGEIACALNMDERQLLRIRSDVADAQGQAPPTRSRRPHRTRTLDPTVQKLIRDIQRSAPKDHPYGPTEIKDKIEKHYREVLEAHHGGQHIAATTVSKYMNKRTDQPPREHPRGSYVYPEPFQAVALDTSYFDFFGTTFYLITVFELGGRLNLVTEVFLRENTEAVLAVVEEYLTRFPGIEVAVIDRGTPYLNEPVRQLLEDHGRFRIVCPPETPTAKAAIERHFDTLKTVLHQALATVFFEAPGWAPPVITKLFETAVAVFQLLYHQIPQEGIDGKSPAERILEFDPVRACERITDLFRRSLDSEPADQYARTMHARFQLSGSEAETVAALRRYGTPVLRGVVEKVKAYMGPPLPDWMYNPLGFLIAKARELWEERRKAANAQRWRQAQEKAAIKEEEGHRAEARERQEHPERFIDAALRTLALSVKNNHGVRFSLGHVRDLLKSLAEKLRGLFAHEISRLKTLLETFSDQPHVRASVARLLDETVQVLAAVQGQPLQVPAGP
jgi:hypothetical protein